MVWNNGKLIKVLTAGGIVVMPTDTMYGIVGKAENPAEVERIYKIRKRAPEKPCIILIGDINELKKFSINLSEKQKTVIKKYWSFDSTQDLQPEPTSIVFDCPDEKFQYLHRGTKTLAFRIPSPQSLRDLLLKVGPLIAPSANPEGFSPSKNTTEAAAYFGDAVDLYLDGGPLTNKASKVIKLAQNGSVTVLRK